MNNYAITFKNMDWENPAPGLRTKVFLHKSKRLRLVEFAPEFVEPDWCEKGHAGYVISGNMQIEFANHGVQNFETGDAIFIPEGQEHKHRHFKSIETATLFLVEDNTMP